MPEDMLSEAGLASEPEKEEKMNRTLFLCPKCADIMQHSYGADEVPDTFANDKCEMCNRKRFGCKYEVKK